MNLKRHVTDVVLTMPDDVTLDEVVYWVGVMEMLGADVPSQKELYSQLFTDLQRDMADYFSTKKSERSRRPATKSKKRRSVDAA